MIDHDPPCTISVFDGRQVQKGDRVTLSAVVDATGGGSVRFVGGGWAPNERVIGHEKAIGVGDKVTLAFNPGLVFTVKAVEGDRAWCFDGPKSAYTFLVDHLERANA